MNKVEIVTAIKELREHLYPADRSTTGTVTRNEYFELLKRIESFLKVLENNL